MSFVVPTSLSPSRVESFTSCPMAFRFASIEKLPEPPSPQATKGSLVHRALEILFTHAAPERVGEVVERSFRQAVDEYAVDEEFTLLGLDDTERQAFVDDAWTLVESYLRMEDPTQVHDVGLEIRLEAQVGALTLRGIIDRLEFGPAGELIVTDYKTGRAPSMKYEQSRLGGVHFYSFLCESVLGRRPDAIRLMYLRSGETITAVPSEQSVRFITTRTTAVWKAVERACTTGDFRPRQGPLCNSCSFRSWCPAFGGDPELAKVEAPVAFGRLAAGVSLAGRVTAFDARADRALEPWRDRRGVDRVFHLASTVGDFSLVWQVIGAAYGLGVRRDVGEWLLFAALMGVESLLVNQGIKRLFRRTRPTETGDPRFPVRRPRTSSFPSGHASSACFAATLLTAWSGWPWAPLWFAIALVVATSRAVVRIHHPSDVIGGMVVGLLLGQIAIVWFP